MKYNIGDKFWRVNKEYNKLNGLAKKLKMTDADGNEWYRYDRDTIDFDIKEVYIVGTFNAIIEGYSVWDKEDYLDRYCVYDGSLHKEVHEDELDGNYQGAYATYWKTKEEAESYVKKERERLS